MVHHKNLVVCVKSNGKVLREHGETAYLPFGSEYSLLIKNLHSRRVLVNVEVDGREAIKGLIIEPNSESELERFFEGDMKKGHKFKFIEKSDDIKEFRGDRADDGIIRVEYQFEAVFDRNPWRNRKRYPWEDYNPWNPTFGSVDYDQYNQPYMINTNIGGSFSSTVECNTVECNNVSYNANEDGITVEGGESSQQFVPGNIGLLDNTKYVISLCLKGYYPSQEKKVEKPLTVQQKLQCKYCGKKWKSNNKFCGNCGAALI